MKAEAQFATVMQALDAAFARCEARSIEVLGYELPQVLLIHCNEIVNPVPRPVAGLLTAPITFCPHSKLLSGPCPSPTSRAEFLKQKRVNR